MDVTGNRRWWPVEVQGVIQTERLADDLTTLWGAAVAIYREMREAQPYGHLPLFLQDPASIAEAERLQFKAKVAQDSDILADRLAPFLNEIKATDDPFEFDGTFAQMFEHLTARKADLDVLKAGKSVLDGMVDAYLNGGDIYLPRKLRKKSELAEIGGPDRG